MKKIRLPGLPQSMSSYYNKEKNLWGGILDLKHKSKFINTVFVLNDTVFYAQIPTTFLDEKEKRFDFEK